MPDVLERAIASGEVSGGYIVNGASNDAVRSYIAGFLVALFCDVRKRDGGDAACGNCPGCAKARSENHADLLVIRGGGATIKVDEVRAVFSFAAQKPYEGGYKAVVIGEADRMTPQAQNALLKILEEPPTDTVFLLGAVNIKNLLPTILSRCIILNTRTHGKGGEALPEGQADILMRAAAGDSYLAAEYAQKGYFDVRADALVALNRLLYAKTMATSVTEKLFLKHEGDLGFMMSVALIYLGDVIGYKYTKDVERLINADLFDDIQKHSALPARLLINTLDLIAGFYANCEICAGLNKKLALTGLLFNILEVVVQK